MQGQDTGQLSLMPFTVPEGMKLKTLHMTRGGNHLFQSVAFVGETTSPPEQPCVVMVYEFPTQECEAVNKSALELNDVNHFLYDVLPTDRITAQAVPGPHANEPPDVIAYVDGSAVRIEAAQFVMPNPASDPTNAIARWSMFERFRNRLLETHTAAKYAAHRGLLVAAWFNVTETEAQTRLPPKKGDAIDRVVDGLRNMTPPAPTSAPLPDVISPDARRESEDGAFGFTWVALPSGYSSPFFDRMGFELALSYHITLKRTDFRNEIVRIAHQHDSPATDVLVITVNAPVRSGLLFPSSLLLASMLAEDDDPLGGWTPEHLSHIALHDQGRGVVRWLRGGTLWD